MGPSTSSTDLKENKLDALEDTNGSFLDETYGIVSSTQKSIENYEDSLSFTGNREQQRNEQHQMHELYEQCQTLKQRNDELYEENAKNIEIMKQITQNSQDKDAAIIKLKKISHKLDDDRKFLQTENEKLREENRSLMQRLQCMEQEKYEKNGIVEYKNLDFIDYPLWQWQDVYQWMMQIENGKFGIYAKELEQHLKMENIDGSCIKQLTTNDMHRFGIIDFKDKQLILEQIANLKSNFGLDNLINDVLHPNLI